MSPEEFVELLKAKKAELNSGTELDMATHEGRKKAAETMAELISLQIMGADGENEQEVSDLLAFTVVPFISAAVTFFVKGYQEHKEHGDGCDWADPFGRMDDLLANIKGDIRRSMEASFIANDMNPKGMGGVNEETFRYAMELCNSEEKSDEDNS